MKRVMLTILALPLLAGCWWSKDNKNVAAVETTSTDGAETSFDKAEELLGADEEMSEGMAPAASEDEK